MTWQEEWNRKAKSLDKMRTSFSLKKQYKNVLFLLHGDLDGIISGVKFYPIIEPIAKRIEILFTQPHWIHEHSHADIYDLIVVLDIAVNNRDKQMTYNFIKKHGDHLVWIDHHVSPIKSKGWIIFDSSCKSNVQLLDKVFKDQKYSAKINKLSKLAHLTDQGQGDNIYNQALKINLRNDETRKNILDYGVSLKGGELERHSYEKIKEKADKYAEILTNTLNIVEKNRKRYGNISIVDIRNFRDKTIDKTLVFFKCYETGTPIVIMKYLSNKDGEEYITVSRSNNLYELNLAEVFKIPSGAKFRVTKKNKWSDEELVMMLTKGLKKR
jgi:hypothetical protein